MMLKMGENKRSKTELAFTMMQIMQTEHKITNIMFKCGIGFRTVKSLLESLINRKYVEMGPKINKQTLRTYHLTPKGVSALTEMHRMNSVIPFFNGGK